ncbi:MAG: type II toxin-antitoxin system prevent-host-death family antitoxin [Chloroflexota bacterium]
MRRIGVRELRQQASKYLRDVERGESIEVTDRGRAVARLVPVSPEDTYEELIRSGRIRPGKGELLDLGPPLPPKPGVPLPSEILAEMRRDER